MIPKIRERAIALCLTVCLCVAAPARAQVETGNLFGTVVDAGGSPLPGATVTLQGAGGEPQVHVTDAQGNFRFLGLGPGSYTVRADLESFSTVDVPNVRVNAGRNATIEITLSSRVDDVITVSFESPLLDEAASARTSITPGDLEHIPTVHDPWAILQTTPGVLTDRINVGGNESGLQSSYVGPGTTASQWLWMVDGVVISDMAALGASPAYYDFDSFEEMEVTTAGRDPTLASSGVVLNIVTKRGTNEWSGSARYYLGPDAWAGDLGDIVQETNRSDVLNHELSSLGDFGADLGGPIIRDRLWIWGSYGTTDINGRAYSGGTPLDTNLELDRFSTKLGAKPSPDNSLTFGLYQADRRKQGRNFERLLAPETTYRNEGAPDHWKIEDTHVFSSNFYLTGLYSHVNGGYSLTPQSTARAALLDQGGVFHNTFQLYNTERPQEQFKADASTFFNAGSLSHELKFGVGYRSQETREESGWPLDQIARDDGGQQNYYFTRDWSRTFENSQTSVYVQDTLTLGNLTLNLGLRYDTQSTQMIGGQVAAHPNESNFMRAESFGEEDAFEWNGILPRVGLTFNLGEKTLLKANYARYADQIGTLPAEFGTSATLNPFYGALVKQGTDVDGNGALNPGEPQAPVGFFPLDVPNLVDDELDGADYQELLFGVEHALRPEFVVGVNLTFRRVSNTFAVRDLLTNGQPAAASHYMPGNPLAGSIEGFGTYSVPTYYLNPQYQFSGQELLTNGDGEQEYLGASLTFSKRLANRWMLRGNVSWQDWNWDVPAAEEAASDPNRILGRAFDLDPFLQRSGELGSKPDVFIAAGWSYNLNGLYQVAPDHPWGFNLGLNVSGRQGYPSLFHRSFTGPDNATRDIQLFPAGEFRNDAIHLVDLRLDRSFDIFGTALTLGVDVFNLLNEETVLQRAGEVGGMVPAGVATEVTGPRVIRLGARLRF